MTVFARLSSIRLLRTAYSMGVRSFVPDVLLHSLARVCARMRTYVGCQQVVPLRKEGLLLPSPSVLLCRASYCPYRQNVVLEVCPPIFLHTK